MTKIRLLVLLATFLFVGSIGTLVFLYARGFRFNQKTGKVSQNGILVIKSHPDGAQVFINGELKTGTNATVPLAPNTYDVSVRKDGYITWEKRLLIEKEVVIEATAHLFKMAPSLSAVTFSGALNPVSSPDKTKIAYVALPIAENRGGEGLWLIETINLPLGFARDPKRLTDGDLSQSSIIWSPNSKEILLTTTKGTYLLDAATFTPQSQRINVSTQREEILKTWQVNTEKRLQAQIKKLPEELKDTLNRKARAVVFSPDEDMVLYTASGSANIPENLIKPIPGSSSQKQERSIEDGRTYVYDIKEDRNFYITTGDILLDGWLNYQEAINQLSDVNTATRSLAWYPSSRHLILAEETNITIMDYDATNKQTVYSGSYVAPHIYPTLSMDRLLILTNLGADSASPNLYSLGIK
ncbi:hypothetical protein A2865_01165 [Candidatus Woesebacteria bacterium RIFCSPHIGHO2_01_FULL_39_17]|uniref:PEGA domain-containing protein n=2 Tax=Candidatus Woeseibacteriota TaxID=1752722 RepID=A0A0G0PUK6_9BACT|nr:MAG: hypothetical protein UT19_C0021G0002 [Candidatus Woesebacteria bacterium GW2011_GWB1_39_10b]OGM22964.1 MAG: hypothetical protein A2865_01165 [Candidatus Woesebacteria bacterium RIFCSPHIGHO2_01_FULL_39_17]OGM61785.1 MAG: hypothetical protein A3A52_04555 [Candidatus Woesebacteria bacterium RIFCSPLOWO2_01_FULL_39_14]